MDVGKAGDSVRRCVSVGEQDLSSYVCDRVGIWLAGGTAVITDGMGDMSAQPDRSVAKRLNNIKACLRVCWRNNMFVLTVFV